MQPDYHGSATDLYPLKYQWKNSKGLDRRAMRGDDYESNGWLIHAVIQFHYRASICEGGLGSRNSVCPSVCLSVCLSHAWIVTKLNDALQIFYTTRKDNHSATLTPRVVGRRRPLPSEICVQSDPPSFEKRRFRPISAHNVSTVGDSEKSSITTNIKSTTGFPTSHRWSAYVTLSALKGGSNSDFFAFEHKSTADRLKRCQPRWPACVINM